LILPQRDVLQKLKKRILVEAPGSYLLEKSVSDFEVALPCFLCLWLLLFLKTSRKGRNPEELSFGVYSHVC